MKGDIRVSKCEECVSCDGDRSTFQDGGKIILRPIEGKNENKEVRNCTTCVHCDLSPNSHKFDFCKRFQTYTDFAINDTWIGYKACGFELREWQPKSKKQPRRSLKTWLWDTFLNREKEAENKAG